jgi:tungstate transport system ATP-binding protein
MLALFARPDTGTVAVDGQPAWVATEAERLALRRRIGMVFQEASLFDATVARNAECGLHVRRSWDDRLRRRVRSLLGARETPAAVTRALDVVGLGGSLDQSASSLSGGEAQRDVVCAGARVRSDV